MSESSDTPNILIDGPSGEFSICGESIKRTAAFVTEQVQRHDPMFQQISEWIQPGVGEQIESKQKDFNNRSYLMWASSIVHVLEDRYTLIRTDSFSGHSGARASPVYLHESFGEHNLRVPHRMTLFFESSDDESERIAVSFYPYDKWDVELRFHYCHGHTDFTRLWTEIEYHFSRHGLLKGAKFNGNYDMLKLDEIDWGSVVLGDGKRQLIERNVIGFLNNLDRFSGTSLRASRGLLLVGPPGTGKTLTCRVVMSQVDCTVMYITRDHIRAVGDIDDMYKLARRLAPTLLVFEDIDTLGGLDRTEGDHPGLGEFLNCLSGVESNDGVITLATTNYPQKLDWALTDRPGRFDMRLDIDYPDTEDRVEILERYLSGLPVKVKELNKNATKIAKRTDGYSGAYLQEIVQSAYLGGLERNNYAKENKWKVLWEDFDTALTVVERMRGASGRVIEPRTYKAPEHVNAHYG